MKKKPPKISASGINPVWKRRPRTAPASVTRKLRIRHRLLECPWWAGGEASWSPLIHLQRAGRANFHFGGHWEEKAEAHRSPVDFLSHSASPFTSCGAELQWSYASSLKASLSLPPRLTAGILHAIALLGSSGRPARESITDNTAHGGSGPSTAAWRGRTALRGNGNRRSQAALKEPRRGPSISKALEGENVPLRSSPLC